MLFIRYLKDKYLPSDNIDVDQSSRPVFQWQRLSHVLTHEADANIAIAYSRVYNVHVPSCTLSSANLILVPILCSTYKLKTRHMTSAVRP